MEYYNLPPELAAPPPEPGMKPELELAAPPPEFGQGTAPPGPAAGKKRRLRRVLSLPALLLTGFLCFHTVGALPAPALPEPSAPGETQGPAETLEPAETLPAEVPGSLVLDVVYAVREGETVHYSYTVYLPTPSLDAPQTETQSPVWPVEVYTRVTDEAGRTLAPAGDPDVWEGSRPAFDYSLDLQGLEGDLTLTLTAVYDEDGQRRQTQAELPLEALPAAPEPFAALEVRADGTIGYLGGLIPAPGTEAAYALEPTRFTLVWYDETGEILGVSPALEADGLPELSGYGPVPGREDLGFAAAYDGPANLGSAPEGTAAVAASLVLTDQTHRYPYTIDSDPVPLPGETRETYPLGDGTLVFTVYNDTLNFDVPSPVEVEDDYRTFLAVDSVAEAGFTGYDLPDPAAPAGYSFAGWVIHVNNPMDLGGDTEIFQEYNGDPPVNVLIPEESFAFSVGTTITPEDVALVPPTQTEEGESIRFINVHAVWIQENPGDPAFYLDDGQGSVTGYGMLSPMYSEGFLYLCAYPVPERPGYVFDGWYDSEGNRVDLLVSYFSFTPAVYGEDGSFQGYDWNAQAEPFTLYAHWRAE